MQYRLAFATSETLQLGALIGVFKAGVDMMAKMGAKTELPWDEIWCVNNSVVNENCRVSASEWVMQVYITQIYK